VRSFAGALHSIGVPGAPFPGVLLPRYHMHFGRRDSLSRAQSLRHALPACGGRHHHGSAVSPSLPVASSLCSAIGRMVGWDRVAKLRRTRWCPWFRPRGLTSGEPSTWTSFPLSAIWPAGPAGRLVPLVSDRGCTAPGAPSQVQGGFEMDFWKNDFSENVLNRIKFIS
jgi:hypothetical protein